MVVRNKQHVYRVDSGDRVASRRAELVSLRQGPGLVIDSNSHTQLRAYSGMPDQAELPPPSSPPSTENGLTESAMLSVARGALATCEFVFRGLECQPLTT